MINRRVFVGDLAKLVLQTLGALMTTIVGFYFGSRSATESADKTTKKIMEAAREVRNA